MQITFSLSPTILLIIVFLVHTIITHLMNWWVRNIGSFEDDKGFIWFVLCVAELIVCIILIAKLT